MVKPKQVLIACEYSGIVRDAFIAEGHDAISCDLLPTERPGPHIQGDVREVLQRPWDLVIAHPPCTYLTVARGRLRDIDRLVDAACFFNDCYTANAPMVAVENPLPYKMARTIIGEPDQMVHPYHFGDMYLKRTGLWLRGLPPLMPTSVAGDPEFNMPRWHGATGRRPSLHHFDAHKRSEFHPGMAAAMAKQWGSYGN